MRVKIYVFFTKSLVPSVTYVVNAVGDWVRTQGWSTEDSLVRLAHARKTIHDVLEFECVELFLLVPDDDKGERCIKNMGRFLVKHCQDIDLVTCRLYEKWSHEWCKENTRSSLQSTQHLNGLANGPRLLSVWQKTCQIFDSLNVELGRESSEESDHDGDGEIFCIASLWATKERYNINLELVLGSQDVATFIRITINDHERQSIYRSTTKRQSGTSEIVFSPGHPDGEFRWLTDEVYDSFFNNEQFPEAFDEDTFYKLIEYIARQFAALPV